MMSVNGVMSHMSVLDDPEASCTIPAPCVGLVAQWAFPLVLVVVNTSVEGMCDTMVQQTVEQSDHHGLHPDANTDWDHVHTSPRMSLKPPGQMSVAVEQASSYLIPLEEESCIHRVKCKQWSVTECMKADAEVCEVPVWMTPGFEYFHGTLVDENDHDCSMWVDAVEPHVCYHMVVNGPAARSGCTGEQEWEVAVVSVEWSLWLELEIGMLPLVFAIWYEVPAEYFGVAQLLTCTGCTSPLCQYFDPPGTQAAVLASGGHPGLCSTQNSCEECGHIHGAAVVTANPEQVGHPVAVMQAGIDAMCDVSWETHVETEWSCMELTFDEESLSAKNTTTGETTCTSDGLPGTVDAMTENTSRGRDYIATGENTCCTQVTMFVDTQCSVQKHSVCEDSAIATVGDFTLEEWQVLEEKVDCQRCVVEPYFGGCSSVQIEQQVEVLITWNW